MGGFCFENSREVLDWLNFVLDRPASGTASSVISSIMMCFPGLWRLPACLASMHALPLLLSLLLPVSAMKSPSLLHPSPPRFPSPPASRRPHSAGAGEGIPASH